MKNLRSLVNFKVIFGAIVFAVLIFSMLVAVLWTAKATEISAVPATAIVKVIEAPTATKIPPQQTPTSQPTPGEAGQEPAPIANLTIGNYVQVSGTGGDGLRLHESAGVSSKVQYIAMESEVFVVKDGPMDADGYVWWLLEDPYSENASGWGVANYLAIIQNP